MFAPLLDAVRADIDQQVGWARDEIRRQIRYAAIFILTFDLNQQSGFREANRACDAS